MSVGGTLEESLEPFMFILCSVLITATNMLIVMITKNEALPFALVMDCPWRGRHHQLYTIKSVEASSHGQFACCHAIIEPGPKE